MVPKYGKAIALAPMVRCGTLPLRLLAVRMGADLVYTDELIDRRLLKCRRSENSLEGTVDFLEEDGSPFLRVHREEREKIIVQVGTSDSERAVAALNLVKEDCAGIDCNMGCPKHFSIVNGMGAALMTAEEGNIAAGIVRAMRSAAPPSLGVTCKTRVFPDVEETKTFVKKLTEAGAMAVGLHLRSREERPKDTPRREQLAAAVEAAKPIPVLANGDYWTEDDIATAYASGATSVLLARPALADISLIWRAKRMRDNLGPDAVPPGPFSAKFLEAWDIEKGTAPKRALVAEFVRIAASVGNNWSNTKYTAARMASEGTNTSSDKWRNDLAQAHTPRAIAVVLDCEEDIVQIMKTRGDDPDTPFSRKGRRRVAEAAAAAGTKRPRPETTIQPPPPTRAKQ